MRWLAIIYWLIIGYDSIAQTADFAIFIGNREIGSIQAKRDVLENRSVYHVTSDASFRVVWKYHRTTDMTAIFVDDTLVLSESKVVMNDDVKEDSKYWRDGIHYRCLRQDNEASTEQPVRFSSARLYFEEPVGVDSVYSETFLENSYLKRISETQYKLYLPGNRENIYTYENGELVEIRADRTFDLLFRRVKPAD